MQMTKYINKLCQCLEHKASEHPDISLQSATWNHCDLRQALTPHMLNGNIEVLGQNLKVTPMHEELPDQNINA